MHGGQSRYENGEESREEVGELHICCWALRRCMMVGLRVLLFLGQSLFFTREV